MSIDEVVPVEKPEGRYFRPDPSKIPEDLKSRCQWVVWRAEEREGKQTKVPYDPKTGHHAKSTDSATWGSFDKTLDTFNAGNRDGIGFVLSPKDPIVGIDCDHCVDPTGKPESWAQRIIEKINSYSEVSPSGTGIRIFCKAKLPPGGRKKGKVEVYESGRYLTVTGRHIEGTPRTIEDRQKEVESFHQEVFGEHRTTQSVNQISTMSVSDSSLIQKACEKPNFQKLWSGDFSAYTSQSEADQALCNSLAFWLNRDGARIDAAFRKSGFFREKWDRKHYGDGRTYGQETSNKAIAACKEVYQAGGGKAPQRAEKCLTLILLRDLLLAPDEEIEWTVNGLLPKGGLSGVFGKPKGGKSTFERCLALAVSRGEDFLGRKTYKGPVVYLALEEKLSEVRRHFQDQGATGQEEIYIYASTMPTDGLQQTYRVAKEKHPALIIIDPLFRFIRVKDSSAYAEVTTALEPLLSLARETGAHVSAVHHMGKIGHGADGILGSTAIFGSVDTALILTRGEHYRTMSSVQRYGEDMPETVLLFNEDTRRVSLGASKEGQEEIRAGEAILEFLQGLSEPVKEQVIGAEVEGRRAILQKALRCLVREKRVERLGKGGKTDPFRYHIPVQKNAGTSTEMPQEEREVKEPIIDVPTTPYRVHGYMNNFEAVTDRENSCFSCARDFEKTPNNRVHPKAYSSRVEHNLTNLTVTATENLREHESIQEWMEDFDPEDLPDVPEEPATWEEV